MQHRGRKNVFDRMITAADAGDLPEIEAKSARKRPEPPDHLSPAMQAWWRHVMAERDLDPHRLHLAAARPASAGYEHAARATRSDAAELPGRQVASQPSGGGGLGGPGGGGGEGARDKEKGGGKGGDRPLPGRS